MRCAWSRVFTTIVAAAAAVGTSRAEGADADIVVENAQVLTMRDSAFRRMTLLVRDGRFAAAAPGEDAERIDLAGSYIIPGLAEMHAHIPGQRLDVPGYRDDVLFLWVANGVTRARGMLGHPSHLALRDAVARHETLGPALILSGPSFSGGSARQAEQAAQRVRAQKAAGYDLLKIHPGLAPDVFAAVARAATAADIRFAGHVTESVGLFGVLAAGQHTIDHLDGFVETLVAPEHLANRRPAWFGADLLPHADPARIPALVAALREAGAAVVPTETLLENVAGDLEALQARAESVYLPPTLRAGYARAVGGFNQDAAKRFLALRKRLINAAFRGGVPILLGSDAPQIFNVPGFSIHRELAALVAAGLTPFEAIAAGTVAPAAFYGQAHQWGAIAPGLDADFIALAADPLADISATRKIVGVMVRGRYLNRQALDAGLADIRNRYR